MANENDRKEQEYQSIREELSKKEYSKEDLIEMMIENHRVAEEKNSQLTEENTSLKEKVSKTDELEEENTKLKEENASLKEFNKSINEDYIMTNEENEKLRNDNEKLYNSNTYLMDELSKKNEKVIDLQEQVRTEKEKSQNLGKVVDKRLSPEAQEKITNVVQKDRRQQAEERLQRIGKIRGKRVREGLKEKYYTRHMDNAKAHKNAVKGMASDAGKVALGVAGAATIAGAAVAGKAVRGAEKLAEKIAVPIAGKVGEGIRNFKQKAEARKEANQIKREKRARAVNEFFGNLKEKRKKAAEYVNRFAMNTAVKVQMKGQEISEGFQNKMDKLKESYNNRVQAEKSDRSQVVL